MLSIETIDYHTGGEPLRIVTAGLPEIPGESMLEDRLDIKIHRSPTGTGVSGRAAIHWSRGELALGERLTIESIIDTRFSVCCLEEIQVGETP
jgi:proline racemase